MSEREWFEGRPAKSPWLWHTRRLWMPFLWLWVMLVHLPEYLIHRRGKR